MRYDKEVFAYISENSRKYNPKLGRYEELQKQGYKYHANLTYSLERNRELFGDVDSDILILRIQGKINTIPSFFIIDNKKYKLVKKVEYKHDTIFYVRGVK